MSSLIAEEQLKEWLGYDSRAKIQKLLKEKRIPYIEGKEGRICTTIEAINSQLLEAKRGGCQLFCVTTRFKHSPLNDLQTQS